MKLNFKKILAEAINPDAEKFIDRFTGGPAKEKPVSDAAMEATKHLPFDEHHQFILPSSSGKEDVDKVLAEKGFSNPNYETGKVSDKYGRETNIARVLAKHAPNLVEKFNTRQDWHKQKEEPYDIVLSRHKYDIGGMSTDKSWSSCQRISSEHHYISDPDSTGLLKVHKDINAGSLVAYLMKKEDASKRGDKTKPINVNHAIARITLKPYKQASVNAEGNVTVDKDSKDIRYQTSTIYGNRQEAFRSNVKKFLDEHMPLPQEAAYKRVEGPYNDGEPDTIVGKPSKNWKPTEENKPYSALLVQNNELDSGRARAAMKINPSLYRHISAYNPDRFMDDDPKRPSEESFQGMVNDASDHLLKKDTLKFRDIHGNSYGEGSDYSHVANVFQYSKNKDTIEKLLPKMGVNGEHTNGENPVYYLTNNKNLPIEDRRDLVMKAAPYSKDFHRAENLRNLYYGAKANEKEKALEGLEKNEDPNIRSFVANNGTKEQKTYLAQHETHPQVLATVLNNLSLEHKDHYKAMNDLVQRMAKTGGDDALSQFLQERQFSRNRSKLINIVLKHSKNPNNFDVHVAKMSDDPQKLSAVINRGNMEALYHMSNAGHFNNEKLRNQLLTKALRDEEFGKKFFSVDNNYMRNELYHHIPAAHPSLLRLYDKETNDENKKRLFSRMFTSEYGPIGKQKAARSDAMLTAALHRAKIAHDIAKPIADAADAEYDRIKRDPNSTWEDRDKASHNFVIAFRPVKNFHDMIEDTEYRTHPNYGGAQSKSYARAFARKHLAIKHRNEAAKLTKKANAYPENSGTRTSFLDAARRELNSANRHEVPEKGAPKLNESNLKTLSEFLNESQFDLNSDHENFIDRYTSHKINPSEEEKAKGYDRNASEQAVYSTEHVPYNRHHQLIVPLQSERPEVEQHLKAKGWDIKNYNEGTATRKIKLTAGPFAGQEKEQEKNISRLIDDKKLLEKFNTRAKFGDEEGDDPDYHIVFSRHKYDVGGMSTNKAWSSCQNLDDLQHHDNGHYDSNDNWIEDEDNDDFGNIKVHHEMDAGTIVSYLVKGEHIPKEAHEGRKAVDTSYATARIALRPYYENGKLPGTRSEYDREKGQYVYKDHKAKAVYHVGTVYTNDAEDTSEETFKDNVQKYLDKYHPLKENTIYKIHPEVYHETPSRIYGKLNDDYDFSKMPAHDLDELIRASRGKMSEHLATRIADTEQTGSAAYYTPTQQREQRYDALGQAGYLKKYPKLATKAIEQGHIKAAAAYGDISKPETFNKIMNHENFDPNAFRLMVHNFGSSLPSADHIIKAYNTAIAKSPNGTETRWAADNLLGVAHRYVGSKDKASAEKIGDMFVHSDDSSQRREVANLGIEKHLNILKNDEAAHVRSRVLVNGTPEIQKHVLENHPEDIHDFAANKLYYNFDEPDEVKQHAADLVYNTLKNNFSKLSNSDISGSGSRNTESTMSYLAANKQARPEHLDFIMKHANSSHTIGSALLNPNLQNATKHIDTLLSGKFKPLTPEDHAEYNQRQHHWSDNQRGLNNKDLFTADTLARARPAGEQSAVAADKNKDYLARHEVWNAYSSGRMIRETMFDKGSADQKAFLMKHEESPDSIFFTVKDKLPKMNDEDKLKISRAIVSNPKFENMIEPYWQRHIYNPNTGRYDPASRDNPKNNSILVNLPEEVTNEYMKSRKPLQRDRYKDIMDTLRNKVGM